MRNETEHVFTFYLTFCFMHKLNGEKRMQVISILILKLTLNDIIKKPSNLANVFNSVICKFVIEI